MDQAYNGISGLTDIEVTNIRKSYGKNILKPKQKGIFFLLLKEFANPLIILLIIAGIFSYFTGSQFELITIIIIILINIIIGFIHHIRSRNLLNKLTSLIPSYIKVIRNNIVQTIEKSEIVPGDILIINSNMIAPADCVLLKSKDVLVDESMLTGESALTEKKQNIYFDPKFIEGMLYAGTTIKSGEGLAKVLYTGKNTKYGEITNSVADAHKKTLYEENLDKLSKDLIILAVVFVLLILTLNLIFNKDNRLGEILLFVIAIAITIVPEGLPAIASITLSGAARKLLKRGVFIKHLASIEDLGNIDVICTDKTGTLTENKLIVTLVDPEGLSNSKFLNYLNLSSFGSTDPFDLAINNYLKDKNIKETKFSFKNIPFDPQKKYSKRVFSDFEILKGVTEVILKDSDPVLKESLLKEEKEMSKRGWRCLAYGIKKDSKIKFIGFVFFADKIKKDSVEIISKFKLQDIKIKIITGDSLETSRYVAKRIHLIENDSEVIEASEIDFSNKKKLIEICNKYHVFCRVDPIQKEKIINALMDQGLHVAYLGDGINDVPSLANANVSIVVENATDVAKQTADIILMRKNLDLIFNAIFEGRKAFENTDKYIKHILVGNFGNFFTLGIVSLFIKFLPMLPFQILISNLIIDITSISFAFDNVDDKLIKKPHHRKLEDIIKLALILGLVTSVLDIVLLSIIQFLPEASIQSVWFCTSAIAEILFIYSVRTNNIFFKSKPGKLTYILTIIAILLFLIITFGGFVGIPKENILEINILPFVLTVSLVYFVVTEIGKLILNKKFNG